MKKNILLCSLMCGLLTACQSPAVNMIPSQNIQPAPQPQQQVIIDAEKKQHQKPVIALVLGSGGARGYAHIGVLQVLEQKGIKPDFIVGTSAGSLAGVLYSAKQSAQSVYDIAQELKVSDIREFDVGLQGFFAGEKIAEFVNKQINFQKLEELKTPVYIVATRLDNGEQTIFNYGDAGQAVQASISIPSMFAPVKIGQYEYVDGGLVSPVPVKVAKQLGADMVIAVNILAQPNYTKTTNMWGLFNQNINIMQNKMADEEMKYAEIVIQPDVREKSHVFDIKTRNNMIQAGVLATTDKIPQIEQYIQQLEEQAKEQAKDSVQEQEQNNVSSGE